VTFAPLGCGAKSTGRKPEAVASGFFVGGKVKMRTNSLHKSEKGNLVMTPRTTSEMLTGR